MNNFNDKNLNNLRYLEAILRNENVSRAAEELNVTQSALSHCMKDLRLEFNDPLLVKTGRLVELTPFAKELRERLRIRLEYLHSIYDLKKYNDQKSRQLVTFTMTDFAEALFMPSLIRTLKEAQKDWEIQVMSIDQKNFQRELAQPTSHFYIGYLPKNAPGFKRKSLLRDKYQILSKNRLKKVDLETFLDKKYVVISPTLESVSGFDQELKKRGLKREVALRTPSFANAVQIALENDFLVVVPKRIESTRLNQNYHLYDPPFPLPELQIDLLWPEIWDLEEFHMEIRRLL